MVRNRWLVIGGILVSSILLPLIFVSPVVQAQRAINAPPFSPRIFLTPVPGVPFSATLDVEITRALTNGSAFQRKSSAMIARDSRGRIHNELRQNLPFASTQQPHLLSVHIYDPDTGINTFLTPSTRLARLRQGAPHSPAAPPFNWAQHQPSNAQANAGVQFQDLGSSMMEGVDVHGYSRAVTLPNKFTGTGQSVVITDEYWYSEDLRINMMEKHIDPRTGVLTVTVTNLNRVEPPPEMFEVPLDYKVVDMTPPAQASQ